MSKTLVLIAPGSTAIPPKGWGAVESLLWDYKICIEKYYPNIRVRIVNETDKQVMIEKTNACMPDVVHIQYDEHIDIAPYLRCKRVFFTPHYAYQDQQDYRNDPYFLAIVRGVLYCDATVLCLSSSISKTFIQRGVPSNRCFIQHNGANNELFSFVDTPVFPERSIYLAAISDRKRQHVYQTLSMIYFVGNGDHDKFDKTSERYLGEWTKPELYENLTNYANLVLLSDGEAHPLVCCEALICGLGLVVSEFAAANLDLSLPFIDVIPTNKLNDLPYIEGVILQNQKISTLYREDIRKYGIEHFGWKNVVDSYISTIGLSKN